MPKKKKNWIKLLNEYAHSPNDPVKFIKKVLPDWRFYLPSAKSFP